MPSEAPSRLHPFSLVRGLSVRELLQAIPGAIVAVSALGSLGSVAAVLVVAGALVAFRIAAYRRHTYQLMDDEVVERRGVFQRRERILHLDRLQQVEVDQGLLDRLVGTAVVRLETASESGASELELRVVSEAEASRLRRALSVRAGPVGSTRPAGEELVHVPLGQVALAAVTGPRLLAIPVVVLGAVGLLFDLDLMDEARSIATPWLGQNQLVVVCALVVAALALSLLAALALGILRDGDFRIRRVGDDLHVRRGLVATREAVVPVDRLQLVAIRRSTIRRLLGFGSLELHSAGGAGDRGALERRLTVPLVSERELEPLALRLLGRGPTLPALHPHPTAARIRAQLRQGRSLAVPAAGLLVLLGAVGQLTALRAVALGAVIVGLAAGLGALEHRHLASGRDDELVVARGGALTIEERIAPVAKVQGSRVRSSPFQRRRSLTSVTVHIAGPGGAVRIQDLDESSGLALQRALERPDLSAASAGR